MRLDELSESHRMGADFWGRGCDEARFSEKKGLFSEKGGGNSVNEGFGKDFYRKGNSVKRGPGHSGHSVNRRTLKIEKLLSSSPSRKSALTEVAMSVLCIHSLRIYPYPMVWPLPRPWSPSEHRKP